MSEMSVCCVPSDREPFPRTVLEAQLLGIPVVAANSGGCPEMVNNGWSGILFSSTAPDAAGQLAMAITTILLDSALARSLASHAQEEVLGSVAGPKPVHHFEILLNSLCGMEG
jgi:glycosyltransferase involved in cell wall biosynthesis